MTNGKPPVPKTSGLSVFKTAPPPTSSSPKKSPSCPDLNKASGGLSVFKTAVKAPVQLSVLESSAGMESFLALELSDRLLKIESLFSSLSKDSCSDFIAIIKRCNVSSQEGTKCIFSMIERIESGKDREAALTFLSSTLSLGENVGRSIEPFSVKILPNLLNLHADRVQAVRELAAKCCSVLADVICPYSFRVIYPMLSAGMVEEDWRIKVGTLQMIKRFASRLSAQISMLLPSIIPQISECIYDSKLQVKTAGLEAMLSACSGISNEDIRHLVPQLVSVIARPEESAATLDSLLETTFVTNVDAPTLALIAPLLGKSLRGRSSVLKRKAARVERNEVLQTKTDRERTKSKDGVVVAHTANVRRLDRVYLLSGKRAEQRGDFTFSWVAVSWVANRRKPMGCEGRKNQIGVSNTDL
jgi:hypothetical protein